MSDPYADFILTANGADLSVVWLAKGGATLSIGGDQPMDQRPCSITLTDADLIRLVSHIAEIGCNGRGELRNALFGSALTVMFPNTRKAYDPEPERTAGWKP